MGEPRHATEGGGGAPRSAPTRRSARPPAPTASRLAEDGERPTAGRAALVQLQALAGNSAVAGLLSAPRRSVQRLVGSIPPPPVAPSAPDPAQHPGFRAATGRLAGARSKARSHPSPRTQADAAGRAAKPPADHKESQAKAAKAGEMGAAPVGGFDKAAFIAAVSAAIAKQAPKNLEEADKFAESDKSAAVAAEVKGKVGASKDASAKPIADASAKAPDEGKAIDKPVTPLPEPATPGAPAAVNGKEAMPTRAPAEQTELGNGPAETDTKMAEAGVTEDQLAHSNEPEFTGALTAKKEGEEHSATAPGTFRANEAQQLATAQQGAQATGVQGAAGMVAVRGTALQQAAGAQRRTQTANESDRANVTSKIKSIFDATKTAVDAILNGIDPQVDAAFTAGEAKAKAAFTTHHKARMEKYKDDRYDGLLGAGRWIKDKFADLPSEVNQFYVEAKQIYETQMRGVISDIADLVGRELTRAKTRIAEGRTEITTYVTGLDPKLKSLGKSAAEEIGSQFETLEASVDEKSQSLADDLAEKYVAARTAVDDEIKALQEENKGLWSKAKDAIGGAIETILKLKDMLTGVLARAAGAIGKIIKDPIGFLGNFVGAVKAGVMNFGANILDHLKKGLQSWLFGALAEGGIEIPEKFDLKGIVGLILSLLGLTWASIRARLAKVLPEWVLKALETAVDVVKILSTEGVGGLWTWIVTKISDLKEQVMGQIKDFVITKIITAGITWLISLLNPAAAFIKACKMIYDAVMWFVDNAERMKDFVDSVLDSVESIANGGVGAVASMIESTLAKAIPMVISGLASLLGLGGIAEKIKSILQTIQKPVGKVVDGIIGGVVKYGKKLLKKLKRKKKGAEGTEGGGASPTSRQAFAMAGRPHTLTAVLTAGRVVVTMASTPGELLAKARVAQHNQEEHHAPAAADIASFISTYSPRISQIEGSRQSETSKSTALDGLLREMAARLVGLGQTHHITDLGSYEAIGMPEIELNRLVYGALNTARTSILEQRASAAHGAPSASDGLQDQFDRVIHAASNRYASACAARVSGGSNPQGFSGNVFQFAGASYFVDHDNNYIVPASKVGFRAAVNGKVYVAGRSGLQTLDEVRADGKGRQVVDNYGYAVHSHTSGQFRTFASIVAGGGSLQEDNGAMFLAAMVAEAHRNPNAHVTNLLLLSEGGTTQFTAEAPMTRGGTDTASAPRDPTLASVPGTSAQPPTAVTDAEVAMVRSRYESEHGAPLSELVNTLGEGPVRQNLIAFVTTRARPPGW